VKPAGISGFCLRDKIDELAMNNKNKNIRDLFRGINKFKKDYHSRSNLVKDENGDLLADTHEILNRWRKRHYGLKSINLLILFGITKNGLISGRSAYIIIPVYKKGDKSDYSNYRWL
jgi:hypothetical protein